MTTPEDMLLSAYNSPITIRTISAVHDDFQPELNKAVMERVSSIAKRYEIVIDEESLVQALRQDMQRYDEAYTRGYMDAMHKMEEEQKCQMPET